MPIQTRQVLSNFLIVFLSFLLTLAAIELMLRLIDYNPLGGLLQNEERAVFIRPSSNPERIFEATPNTSGKGWGTEVSINSSGFRGHDYTQEKPAGVYRVVVIGDSIAFGNNLPPESNFPAVLEQMFANAGKHVEVLNLSLGGYDTPQEVATLEQIGLQFKPDMVVVAYCINDIGIASGNLNYIKRLQRYGSPVYKLRLAQFIRVQLDRIDAIAFSKIADSDESFHLAYRDRMANISGDETLASLMNRLRTELAKPDAHYVFSADYTKPDHIKRLRYGLEKLRALQTAHGFSVNVVVFPFLLENQGSHESYQLVYQIVQHEIQHAGFSQTDIYPEFSAEGFANLAIRANDGVHPNARGHEIVANKLYKTISTKLSSGR